MAAGKVQKLGPAADKNGIAIAMPVVFVAIASQNAQHNRGILLAAMVAFLALGGPVLGDPATGNAQTRHQAETARTAQPRHARTARQPVTTALAARTTTSNKRPMLGWPALVTEARRYMGTNPTARSRLWCATFMNMVLARTGYAGTGSDAARSFASYGKRINEPRIGAIAVLTRGKRGGHVGIVSGVDASGNPIIISGNHGKRVGEATYSRARVIAYVMPTERVAPTQVASAGAVSLRSSDADHEDGLSSPIEELLAAINAERTTESRPPPPREAVRRVERVVERAPAARVARPVPLPEPRPRIVTASLLDSAIAPLPRERPADPLTPLPRSRPQL